MKLISENLRFGTPEKERAETLSAFWRDCSGTNHSGQRVQLPRIYPGTLSNVDAEFFIGNIVLLMICDMEWLQL